MLPHRLRTDPVRTVRYVLVSRSPNLAGESLATRYSVCFADPSSGWGEKGKRKNNLTRFRIECLGL